MHRLAHPGLKTTQNLIARLLVWPKINFDVWRWVCPSLSCQKAKIHRHMHSPVLPGSLLSKRFEKVYIHIVGFPPPSEKYTELITIIDRFSWWGEAIFLASIDACTVCNAFLARWGPRFGVPSTITSKWGHQFEASIWRKITRSQINPNHGVSSTVKLHWKRFHCTLTNALCSTENPPLPKSLSLVLLGIRFAYKEDLRTLSAEMV